MPEDAWFHPQAFNDAPARVLVYAGFDNDLADEWPRDLNGLEAIADRVAIQAQVDFPGKGSAGRFVPWFDLRPRKIVTPALPIAEPDSGGVAALLDFLAWGQADRDPGRVVLDVNTHGDSYQGLLHDFTSDSKMRLEAFSDALGQATGGERLGLLSLSACIMANLETVYALRDNARVVVASEDLVDLAPLGDNFYKAFGVLGDRPDLSMDQLGHHLVTVAGHARNYETLSAIRLSEVGPLAQAFDRWAGALLPVVGDRPADAKRIWDKLPRYDDDKVDLGLAVERLSRLDPRLAEPQRQVMEALGRAVIASVAKPGKRGKASGLTVYLPKDQLDPLYRETAFARNFAWLTVLEQLVHAR